MTREEQIAFIFSQIESDATLIILLRNSVKNTINKMDDVGVNDVYTRLRIALGL